VKIGGPPISHVVRWMGLVMGYMHASIRCGRSVSVGRDPVKFVLEAKK
jgi:hypothetical protein